VNVTIENGAVVGGRTRTPEAACESRLRMRLVRIVRLYDDRHDEFEADSARRRSNRLPAEHKPIARRLVAHDYNCRRLRLPLRGRAGHGMGTRGDVDCRDWRRAA
jgi:hypothetical protein